jgi:hypothetical protein
MALRFRPWLVALSSVVPALGAAQTSPDLAPPERYRVRLEYRFFTSQLDGDVARNGGGVEGAPFDLKEDIGIEDDTTWEARGTIRFSPKIKLRGSYTALDYKGAAVLAERIVVDGIGFNIGESTTSSIKGAFYSADLEFDFLARSAGFIGITAGARAPDIDTVLVAAASGKRVFNTYRPVCPAVGLAFRGYAGRLSLEGGFSTFARISGRKTTDFEMSARLHVSDRLAIGGGYRYLSFNAEDDLGLADVSLKGWTYGVELGL